MEFMTQRLLLRHWKEADADNLYKYAKDPAVGPAAGWPPHQNAAESRDIISSVLCGRECYAICLQTDGAAIGTIELKLNGHTDMTQRNDECEMGFWLGRDFWGRGIMPEAARELLRHAFEDLDMKIVWCGYYEGNVKSQRTQEKIGFVYHHTCAQVPVPLMHEIRMGHTNYMTREHWLALQK